MRRCLPPVGKGRQQEKRDALSDPERDNEWGGEYGPYILSRFTSGAKGHCRIYYTMSTWNPYQVMVMQTDLKPGTSANPPR